MGRADTSRIQNRAISRLRWLRGAFLGLIGAGGLGQLTASADAKHGQSRGPATFLSRTSAPAVTGRHIGTIAGAGVAGTSQNGAGVRGTSAAGSGILGSSTTGRAVLGESRGNQPSIEGINAAGGPGVMGSCYGATLSYEVPAAGVAGVGPVGGFGVFGGNDFGDAVYGESKADQFSGVYGYNTSGGFGLTGYSQRGAGVRGSGAPGLLGHGRAGPGVQGISQDDRGGVFQGSAGAIRLVPQASASHPEAGATGDLMVDQVGRLWFCVQGGRPKADWRRIQLMK